jgi:hypothetical protein
MRRDRHGAKKRFPKDAQGHKTPIAWKQPTQTLLIWQAGDRLGSRF